MKKRKRNAEVARKTKETDITVGLVIDGTGKSSVKTGIPFLDHMLELFARHGLFDLKIKAKGDLKVDVHHTNEDTGITLGVAFKKALGSKKGIQRFGDSLVPMDGCLVRVTVDISNRPSLHIHKKLRPELKRLIDRLSLTSGYTFVLAEQFLSSFVTNAGVNMHIEILSFDRDIHHLIEAVFKAAARSLDTATSIDLRKKGVPSTKGRL